MGKDKYYNSKMQKKHRAKKIISLAAKEELDEATMSTEMNLIGVDSDYYRVWNQIVCE